MLRASVVAAVWEHIARQPEVYLNSPQTSQSFVRFAVVIPVAACLGCIALYMAPKNDHRGGPIDVKSELASRLAESDEAVLNTTLHDVRAFLRSKGKRGEFALTSMGVTRGLYSKQTAHGLSRLNESCHFEPENSSNSTSLPPPALLLAGALTERPYLRDVSLCFLFYTESLWTRATGGALGPELARLGARLDDKSLLAHSLHMYQQNHCPGLEGGGFPPTVVLSDKATCEMWWRENERWAARDSLWFVKDSHGSLGKHISLLRGSDVAASALNRLHAHFRVLHRAHRQRQRARALARETDRETERQRDRDRQRDRETETDRQTERQRQRQREREREMVLLCVHERIRS